MIKTVLRVLVASPGDVADERELAERTIVEVNRVLGPDSPVLLQSILAEKDILPGIGSDPQAVINDQLPEFEVFVGIAWTRLGTPTPRAASGTVEEFELAVQRWRQNPSAVAVLFFFSQRHPPLEQIIPDQLSALRAFKESLSGRGVYFKDYQDQDQLRALLTTALVRTAQAWPRADDAAHARVVVNEEVAVQITGISNTDDDADGEDWLDLLALQEEAMGRSNESLTRMTAAIQQLGARTTEKSQQLQALFEEPNPSPTKARRLVNDVAEDLEIYARTLEVELPIFRESWSIVIDRLPRLFTIWSELDPSVSSEAATRGREQLFELRGTMGTTIDTLTEFRGTIARVPRLTSQYKKAARRAIAAMDDLLTELTKIRAFITEFTA
jgi:hypothetical protein